MADGETGKPWTDAEIAVAVNSYFRMLAWQLDDREFVKAEVRHDVMALLPARSEKSVDLKWCNVSAVLNESKLLWLTGFKPLPHVQALLRTAVADWLDQNPAMKARLE